MSTSSHALTALLSTFVIASGHAFASEIPSDHGDTFKKITAAHKTGIEPTEDITIEGKLTAEAEEEEGMSDAYPASEMPAKRTVSSEPAPGTANAEVKPAEVKPAAVKTAAAPVAAEKPAGEKSASAKKPVEAKPTAEKAEAKQDSSRKEVDAETSLRWLTNGNARYVKHQFRSDGRGSMDRQRLLGGESPHAIVLSCSDSRVPTEIVFDQELGEIYTVRVAGEALDSSVIASIEYALENYHPHLLIVMGHTQCSAVEAAMKPKDKSSSDAMEKLLSDIRPRLQTIPEGKGSSNLEIESTVNADGVARDLLKRSEIIKKHVESGDLVIKPALYRMDSGKVSFY